MALRTRAPPPCINQPEIMTPKRGNFPSALHHSSSSMVAVVTEPSAKSRSRPIKMRCTHLSPAFRDSSRKGGPRSFGSAPFSPPYYGQRARICIIIGPPLKQLIVQVVQGFLKRFFRYSSDESQMNWHGCFVIFFWHGNGNAGYKLWPALPLLSNLCNWRDNSGAIEIPK